MKAREILFTVLTLMAATSGFAQHHESFTLRILTYNIYHGETTKGRIDMDLFASVINEVEPDLVALQEVDKNAERSGVIDITEELARRTGLKGYFVKHRDFQGGEYGNAILSRFPVTDIDIIQAHQAVPTGLTMLSATVQLAEGQEIIFNCSHLSTKAGDRAAQAEQLIDHYGRTGGRRPMIITGDLNAEPHHAEIKLLLESFTEADTSFANTFSTRTGLTKKIDYILYPRNEEWQVLETEVLCREDASDHCAFFAVLRYTPLVK